jgi:hypothetical protein
MTMDLIVMWYIVLCPAMIDRHVDKMCGGCAKSYHGPTLGEDVHTA